jgi:hypothetical protein
MGGGPDRRPLQPLSVGIVFAADEPPTHRGTLTMSTHALTRHLLSMARGLHPRAAHKAPGAGLSGKG